MSVLPSSHCLLGISHIDEEHLYIFELIESTIEYCSLEEKEKAWGFFIKLSTFLPDHFKREEFFMEDLEYPFLNIHSIEHKKIVKRLTEIGASFSQHSSCLDFLNSLAELMIDHINQYDVPYVSYYQMSQKK